MLSELGVEILIILVLTLANGVFSGAEIAIVSARRSRLEAQAQEGHSGARRAIELAENPDRFLATVQVGITLIGTFSAAFGGARIGDILTLWIESIPALAPYASTIALSLVVAGITYLSLVFGELLPKRLALQSAETFAVLIAPPMALLSRITRPLIALLTGSVNLIVRLLRISASEEHPVTEEDIVYMVREGTSTGAVDEDQAQMINQVFKFTDSPVTMVMTPRTQITAVEVDAEWQKVLRTFLDSGYSRLPVYDQSIDNVIGVLHARDFMRRFDEASGNVRLRDLMRPAVFVLETQHTDEVMARLRQNGTHLALVIDEYGQVAGLVTMEDLLEELVGEIQDESDTHETDAYVQRADGSWLVDGLQPYDKVRERLGLPEHSSANATTLAGVIIEVLSAIPDVGATLTLGDFTLEVIDMDGRRVDKVLIKPAPPKADEAPAIPSGPLV